MKIPNPTFTLNFPLPRRLNTVNYGGTRFISEEAIGEIETAVETLPTVIPFHCNTRWDAGKKCYIFSVTLRRLPTQERVEEVREKILPASKRYMEERKGEEESPLLLCNEV